MKNILFGAGEFGEKAYKYLGSDQVIYFVDNNMNNVGKMKFDKKIISFDELKKIHKDYRIVISVGGKNAPIIIKQLEDAGIHEYITYMELVNGIKVPEDGEIILWLDKTKKAMEWIEKNSISQEGIINNTGLPKSYPEVSGYYIPTLLKWGERERALTYAKWLCSIQHEDGAWYDTNGNHPYTFDTAQILKGLLAIRHIYDCDENIKRGCDWLITNINEFGDLTTPCKESQDEGVCSQLIHSYCISPLIDAAKVYSEIKYMDAAKKVINFYLTQKRKEILDFSFLAHFYAYVMEAMCDIGEIDFAKEAMQPISAMLDEYGYVPGYKNVKWVCSTAIFQFAVVFYKLGDLERGNKALKYGAKLQNESGGWYGSYPTSMQVDYSDPEQYPNYFETEEISWAVKYFLDAVALKCKLEFEKQAPEFFDTIDLTDGRYKTIESNVLDYVRNYEFKSEKTLKILDAGCGKGRYLHNLLNVLPANEVQLYAMDLSENVMKNINSRIHKTIGTLTQLPYEDESFDIVYTVEALEHTIFAENAMKELLRVTKPGGRVIVLDKNKSALGKWEIDSWEQWFDTSMFEEIAREHGCKLSIDTEIPYADMPSDGTFSCWILDKNELGG